ncbi:MDR/zinc-dependent alcohol dehydrogenase-like family protein [Streptomyces clavifer]|uniref:hypothetical protein n=1 Tax=Streptomyces clavifer TaxID=68188 RepID=UPI00364F6F77
MRAVVVKVSGGPDVVEVVETAPGPGRARIEVAAAARNPVDAAYGAGVLVPARTYPLERATDAYGRLAEGGVRGRLVLAP